ncbi:RluA family pseudouridine synthase [Lysobacter pythonis]|uniref:Dual-specificity RNA pseudouridine synthase RluA n=1 Tax=Solilutibacter pythonis TaxID=2483112 RepID=A0A3M2I4U3_9GAMM|nr:RluA family pseudouridine synthase [Lysobacter pythonis]RMH94559.1 RluA family pseudouridine synthase [Lysobacter pythonis]
MTEEGSRPSIALHHVDAHLLAAEKPAGLLSVPGRLPANRDCLITRLQYEFPDAMTVHRLDQVTSGLVLFGRGAAMQQALSMQFERRQILKRYEALVEGLIQADAGEISLPLICDWANRPRQKVDADAGKPALTRWRVLARDEAACRTRIELEPVTGRSHQLRVHMASIGHVIVGDVFYGAAPAARVCLHALGLIFTHPASGEPMAMASSAPF